MLAAKLIGAEVGDQNHSREFPPKVVDAAYSLLTEQLSSYFRTSTLPFKMPFSLVADKDQSHHRKRLLLGMRVLDLTPGSELIQTIYIAHPASINQTGAGMAKTIYDKLLETGIEHQHLASSYRGLCADGGVLNVNLSDHLLQLFHSTPEIPKSKKNRVIWVWDGAHIVELVFKHTLEKVHSVLRARTHLKPSSSSSRNQVSTRYSDRRALDLTNVFTPPSKLKT